MISRRSVLVAAAAGSLGLVLAGCVPEPPVPTTSPAADADWASLASAITGTLARRGDAAYDTVRLTENPRFDDARPLAVLSAASAADVAAAVAFAARFRLPIALRSGGHSYPGYSAGGAAGTGVKPSLVIDLRPLDAIVLAADNTVKVGAGASLAQVYDAVGSKGRAIAGGSCPTVGITGLTLGGGVGVVVRAWGLTCDSLMAVELVTADGDIHSVDATNDPDLFWACRGGGGGHLGVVTSLTFATRPAPDVTMFSLSWPRASAAAVISGWQDWAPHADPKLWSTLKLLNGPDPDAGFGIFLSGTWLGEASALPAQLAPLIAAAGRPSREVSSQHGYLDAMMSYAGCTGIPVEKCTTAPGGSLTRQAFAATSHVAYDVLDSASIETLIERVTSAASVAGMSQGGISMDALGGQVEALGPTATAFPHREALMTVQYTATFADDADPAPLDTWVRAFRAALQPAWGDGAYVNYADASLANADAAYFGANATRLRAVRKKYDPSGFFTQPQSY